MVNNVLYGISGIRSRIDHVFRDPVIWNSEGPFLFRKESAIVPFSPGSGYTHSVVDCGVLLQPVKTDHELGRGWVQPADVLE